MGTRSRLGCFTCRRRKKKCDEVKPICTACLRNSLGCVWPDLCPPERVNAVGSRQQTYNGQPASESTPWALVSANAHHDLSRGPVPYALAGVTLPGCVSSGIETWALLDHYLKDTANRLACLQDNQNPFLYTILPVALQDELLMNSILALSGVHMMQRLPQLTPKMHCLTWGSYTRALKQLRVALSAAFHETSDIDAVWRALLVVLIFYLLEATRGNDPDAMQRHLEGAHHLMACVIKSSASSTQPGLVFLTTELYVYNAALASFTTNRLPTATPILFSQALGVDIEDGLGVMCGCAHDLFGFIPQVSALLWDLSSHATPLKSQLDNLFARYRGLRVQIEDWKPRSNNSSMVLSAELYRKSLLLLLDSRFTNSDSGSIIDQAFQSLEKLLLHLLPSSPFGTTMTWPLFAFGIHARSLEQRGLIRSYLKISIEIFGMGVMSTALSQLEEMWLAEPEDSVVDMLFLNQRKLKLPLIC
ncbi:hypothetical protein N7492_001132 [Penicillium capsulatum]|uniref:Zn(2)-C6 fungal-type domain-containing protein n=1 Tax=Penicillium capsulatum TaxID=69766 RepID=A0A9W9IU39_9EURO|nr:hypothetical protein N7492_001132 [Penicillium capsulatum]